MGLNFSQLPLLDACHRAGGLQSPLVALGSQQFPDSAAVVSEWARANGHAGWAADPTVAGLFADRYGVDEYVDVDVNDDACERLDLSEPLPPAWRGRAGTVLDLGTTEHVFDLRQAFENVHELLRPGGTFVGVVPLTWWEHGFVNFNPKLFRGIGAANGYTPLVEGFWFRVRLPLLGTRTRVVITREGEPRPGARRWVDRLFNRLQPASTLYLVCMRKGDDAPFLPPTDIFGNW